MSNVPTNLIPTRISQLPEAPVADPAGYFPIVISGTTYKVQFSQIQGSVEVPASRLVNAGTGLTGGGSLSHDITIAVANGGIGNDQLDTTGVAAGTYGSSTAIPVVTVNTKGRVVGMSTTGISISGYVPTTTQIVAGTGLSGGGNLSADRTLAIAYSSTIPSALGSATIGASDNPARADHVHPALDLSDSTETTGVLMMGRGGTGAAMSPVAGAVVVTNGTNFDLTTAGSPGQILFSNGSAPPSWESTNSLIVAAASRLLGGDVNKIVYQASTNDTSFVVSPDSADTFLKWNGSSFEWGAVAGAGTVTSVDGSGGTTGLTVSGGPITAAGTLTLGGTLAISAGGTGLGAAPTDGQLLIGNGAGYTLAALTAGAAISVTNATGSITLANTAPDQTVTLTDGTAIAVTGTYPSFTITNTLPDQTVVISSGTNISVTGTYPSFTVTNSSTADVVGPAGATSDAISLFDGATGKLLKNSVITINGSGVISNVHTPITATDAANKQYVDDLVSSGIHIHTPVVLATSPGSSRTDTYNNGTAGVSATLTSVANGTLVIDGTVASATIRVLIQDCSNPVGNGVYVVTNAGDGSTQYVMTRASDADTSGEQSVQSLDDGSYFFTTGGTSNKGAAWVNTNSGTIVFGSTAITFAEFSSSQVYSAGNGLSLTATTFSLDTPVSVLNGGTGNSSAPTNGQLLIGNGSNFSLAAITAGTGVSVTNATGSITLANTAPDQTVVLTNGTAISVTGTYPSFTVTNTAPDQTVILSGSGIINVTGTYPSFTVGAVQSSSGTVTSVDVAGGTTGLTFSGGPVTGSGVITMAGTLAITNGGTGASSQSGARTALGLGTMAVQDANNVNITGGNASVGSANITTLTGANVTFTSGTVTNLNSTSANITTLTGTTFGETATTQLRGASANITTLTGSNATFTSGTVSNLNSTSANITTLTGTTATYTSATVTNLNVTSVTLSNLNIASANITTLTGTNLTYTSGTVTNLNSTSANITTLTGTTFGTTATTQLRGASAQITNISATSITVTNTPSYVGNGTLTMNVSGTGLSGSQTFTANQSGNATFTVTSNATSANTASAIVARDASGNFSAGTITATLNGNASTATTASNVNNGTLTMNVSGTGLSGSQTFTANQAGNATFTVTSNATSANTASTIVARDASGNFTAGTVTLTGLTVSNTIAGSINGNAASATTINSVAQNLGYALSGQNIFYGGQLGPQVLNQGGGAAAMSFHRVGAFAANLGLDTDNQLGWGGWSYGAALGSMKVGSFGVGTAASGTAGEIRATNNVTAYYSDARLKDFKGKIDGALDKVSQLNGYYYTENAKAEEFGYNNKAMQVGVSAQEVQAVLPEIIAPAPFDMDAENKSKSGENYMTVRYERLVPLLIEAIKELKAEVEALKAAK